jgi:hypothetical protein
MQIARTRASTLARATAQHRTATAFSERPWRSTEPVALDAAKGDHNYVFIYGTATTDLKLLVVPVP